MAVRSSRAKFLTDTASSVVLRNVSDGAETATATETAVALGELDTAWWHDGKDIPGGVFEVNINVTAADVTTGDETYQFDLMVDDAAALNDTPRSIGTLAFAAGVLVAGVYRMYVASDQIKYIDTDSSGTEKYIGIKATLGGTTPSVTYGASIGKVLGA